MEPMKIDKVNNLFICQFCKKTFRDPVILPCFEIICQHDLDEIRNLNDKKVIKCPFCPQQHHEPLNGFQADKRIKELINLEVNKLDFGKTFNNGKMLLKEFEECINEFENLTHDPNEFIQSYFNLIRQKSDTKLKQLKCMLNEHFDKLNSEIKYYENECKQEANCIRYEDFKNELEISRKCLNQWSRDYDSMRLNEEKRDDIIGRTCQAKSELELKINYLKQNILLNLDYYFKSDDLVDKSFLGSIIKSFRFTFNNFTQFKDNTELILESDKYLINGFKWNIEIKHKLDGFIGCYLYCDTKK
jgi:hypothetical protein